MEFSELNLHPDLKKGIAEAGYITCMPVQEQVLTSAFGGQDLYVQSQTGTGKTAAFLIVIFQRLLAESMLGGKKALIMVPTRELAVQVEEEAKVLGKYLPFKAGSFYGGVGYAQQHRLLKDNVQVMVGTPGRVLDLNKTGHMNLMDIAFLVLDEADRMFDMGFYPDLRKLIRVVPPADRRQTMLFSATLNTWVKNLAWEYTKTPKEIEIEPETVTVDEVEQLLYHVPSENKMKLLMGIMEREKPDSAIIFCNTKRYAEIIAKRLRHNNIECEFIIGDLPQVKRLKIIDDIKAGKTNFLVATDVAARGLDIEGLSLVVNYDLPVEAENYVHRIGRTARAGKTGKAFSFASEQDVYELADIEKYIGKKIPSQVANEALYSEDKTEGMRIRTDMYDDRGRGDRDRGGRSSGPGRSSGQRRDGGRDSGRSGSRDGRRDSGRTGSRDGGRTDGRDSERAGGRDSGQGGSRFGGRSGSRDAGRGAGQSADSGEGRSAERQERGAGSAGGRDRGVSNPGRDQLTEQELAGLSLEERMAYYKEKYEGKGGAPRGRPGGDRSGGDRPGTKRPRDEKTRDGKSPDGKNRGRGKRRGNAQGEKRRPAKDTTKSDTQGAAPETKAKPGILGKLLGIFGKK